MKIEYHFLPRMTLAAFADQHGFVMEVFERSATRPLGVARFYARFRDVEVVEGRLLSSTYGDGSTPVDAIAAYARNISGKPLLYTGADRARLEVKAPLLALTEEDCHVQY